MIKVIGLNLNKLFKALLIAIVFLFGLSACKNEDYNSQESLIGSRWGKAILAGEILSISDPSITKLLEKIKNKKINL